MKERQEAATDEMRQVWQSETIRERQERISYEAYNICGGTVKYGPFKGLLLNQDTWWGKLDLGAQCFGLYEKEILDIIDLVEDTEYQSFIDIGAADGYYAIGMLVSGKVKKSICFEQSPDGQKSISKNWEINSKIGEIEIHGEANNISLDKVSSHDLFRSLVLIDIEGYEFDLLSKNVLKKFKDCDLIIEIHNWVDDFEKKYARLIEDILQYFKIEVIERTERPTINIPELRSFTDDNRLLLISERRPCVMRFLKLTPLPPHN